MGIVHAQRGRLAPALTLVALMVLAVVALGLAARPASATSTFTTCASCHTRSAIHAGTTHAAQDCTTCHDATVGLTPKACAASTCHGPAADILAKPMHTTNNCGTTPGCHGVPPAVVTTTMTAKVSPTIAILGRSVKVTGTAGPVASLAGAKVAFRVDRKVGTRWVKMKTGSATVSATGTFKWSYKTIKRGAHRVTSTIAKTSTHTKKSLVRTFRVR